MPEVKDWWSSWAPLWEYMEDQHMSTYVTDRIIDEIKSPVLVIGAGQGLIVNYLQKKGFKADGVDLEERMVEQAKKRHNIDLILGDARELPFEDKSFNTVIISSGVCDYTDDKALIKQFINEALRVTAARGNLFVAFYQVQKRFEKIYKRIGVIFDKQLHNKRIFDIDRISKKNPLACVRPIMGWTGMSYTKTVFFWTLIGLTLPKELLAERSKMEMIFAEAEKMGINFDDLYNCIPEGVPYRDESDIKELLKDLGFIYNTGTRYNDCYLVKFHKSSILSSGRDNYVEPVKEANRMISTKNLCKKYKGAADNAVDFLNITIKKGDIFGLLGPNGAGKTTALSMLMGLLKPSGGKITFGATIDAKNIKKKLGYVPQELALYELLTARENLYFYARLHNIKGKALNERVDYLLKRAGLEESADKLVRKFSTGMKRRLNLVAGLVNNPEIILLDEPTVGIDPQSRNRIFELILKLKEEGVTILYTTHYMEEAIKLCDNLAIMDHGRIIVEGNPQQLIDNYGVARISFKTGESVSRKFIHDLHADTNILDVTEDGDRIIISSSKKTDNIALIDEINTRAHKHKIDLSLINISEPTLESLFLDITGRNLRDTTENTCEERMS